MKYDWIITKLYNIEYLERNINCLVGGFKNTSTVSPEEN